MISLLLALAGATPVEQPPSLAESLTAAPAAVSAPEDPPMNKWTGSVTVGATLTSGNSTRRQATAGFDAELRRANDRFTTVARWLYDQNRNNAANDWQLTDRKTMGQLKYDYFFSKKTYFWGQVGAFNDLQAGIKLRSIYGGGVGHQFREDDKVKFGVEAGVSWFDDDFYQSKDDSYTAARAAYKLVYAINKSWEFNQTAELFPSLEDSRDVFALVNSVLKAQISTNMIGQLQWIYAWDNTPAAGKDKVDEQYLLSVGWKF